MRPAPERPLGRCSWAQTPLLVEYHDREWGVPVHDDRVLFEFLILEGAQAGLSWETILRKRQGYRAAFAEFDPVRVARFTGKLRRQGKFAGYRAEWKKAYVRLAEGEKPIEFFEGM